MVEAKGWRIHQPAYKYSWEGLWVSIEAVFQKLLFFLFILSLGLKLFVKSALNELPDQLSRFHGSQTF